MAKKAPGKKEKGITKISDLRLIRPNRLGKYEDEHKLLAIAFLRATQREYDGKMLPAYSDVSKMLSIPERTLAHWWENKESFDKLRSELLADIPQTLALIAGKELIKLMNFIAEKSEAGYEDITWRDATGLLKELKTCFLLFSQDVKQPDRSGGIEAVIPD